MCNKKLINKLLKQFNNECCHNQKSTLMSKRVEPIDEPSCLNDIHCGQMKELTGGDQLVCIHNPLTGQVIVGSPYEILNRAPFCMKYSTIPKCVEAFLSTNTN